MPLKRSGRPALLINACQRGVLEADLSMFPHVAHHAAERGVVAGNVALLASPVDTILRRTGIATVVLAGVSTNVGSAGCALVAADLGYAGGDRREAPANAFASLSHDGKEAAAAFLKKRPPVFRDY